MSETTDSELSPERQRMLDKRRENLKLARAAKTNRVPSRDPINQRTAETRTAADVGRFDPSIGPMQAKRAEPTREVDTPEVVTRVRRDQRDSGWADLPQNRRKQGWDYEWKVIRVYNEPIDSSDMLEVRNAGWRPETAANWPELVEPGTSPDMPIERRGQRLYGRPYSLTLEARQEDLTEAYRQQRDKTMSAASGKSAVRGEDGIPNQRGVRSVPMEISIEGLAG